MKSSTKMIALFLLAGVVIAITSSRAEWIAQDLSVCTAPERQSGPAIATDKLGNTFIAWLDYRHHPYWDSDYIYMFLQDNEIYMQKLDASGMALWAPDGVNVTSLTRQHGNLRIAADDLGGAYVAFAIDSGTSSGCYDPWVSRIALSKVSSDGAVRWSKYVSNATGLHSEESPMLLHDGSGGALIVWTLFDHFYSYDCGNEWGIPCCYWLRNSICAQRIDPEGERPWGLTPITIASRSSLGGVRAVKIDSSQAIVVWAAGDIFAQKLGMDGSLLWGAAGTTVCASSGTQSGPSVRPDGLGGAIVAWCDGRTVIGISGASVHLCPEAGYCRGLSVGSERRSDRFGAGGLHRNRHYAGAVGRMDRQLDQRHVGGFDAMRAEDRYRGKRSLVSGRDTGHDRREFQGRIPARRSGRRRRGRLRLG